MKLPLSMDFYKLISRTADATAMKDKDGNIASATVKSQYTLALPGLLTPDQKYYWHVRAMNDKGVWGPWSKTWSFTARGVAYPAGRDGGLRPGQGRGDPEVEGQPGGEEAGEVPGVRQRREGLHDRRPEVPEHRGRDQGRRWRPGTPGSRRTSSPRRRPRKWRCWAATSTSPAANKTYYRVVAVDEQGKRSGPSDYATGPRPVIYSKPVRGSQGRRRVPLPGLRQSLPGRPQRANEGQRPGQRLL